MKKALLLLFSVISVQYAIAQAPTQMKYQGVARSASGAPIANGTITVKLDIHSGTATGPVVFSETHAGVTTNQFGLFNINIGSITPLTASVFGAGTEFMEVSVDFGSGLTSLGTSQLLSVPYALYAETSGTPGPVGPQGPAGPVGPSGLDGATGPQGPSGLDGATGPQGPAGPSGLDGATGPQGVAGPSGLDGATGPQGPAGANGATGATGVAGANGATGATGAAGANGATGATGAAGANGATGATGAAGAVGATGPAGATGAVGAAGPTGAAGANGATGATGAVGAQGPIGLTGAAGPAGATGATGVAGATGATGATGPGGITGTTGYHPKFLTANTLGNSIMQENTTGNLSVNITPSISYRFYVYQQQLTANGDGQATVFGYRTRDSQNDGTGYAQSVANDATRGFNFWGDLYTFGVGGWNYNDYTRCGGTFGAEVSGTYWGSLGYRSSGLLNYGVYGSAAYANGGGRLSNGAATGIGGGFAGDLMGAWVRGDVMGLTTSGSMYAAFNVGNTYNTGFHADLVNTNGTVTPAYAVTSTKVKVYDDGTAQLANGTTRVNFSPEFAALVAGGKPTVTITPQGQCNGLYIVSVDEKGFTVAEQNNGTSNVDFSWIVVGTRVDAEAAAVPAELTNPNFSTNMQGVMFNEGNTEQSGKSIWWNGSNLMWTSPPSLTREEKANLLSTRKK